MRIGLASAPRLHQGVAALTESCTESLFSSRSDKDPRLLLGLSLYAISKQLGVNAIVD